MKKQDIYRELSNIDPKMIAEADPNMPRMSAKNRFWRKFTLIAACISLVVTSACLWLFLPYDMGDDPQSIDKNNLPAVLRDHEDSEYLDLMLAFYKYDQSQKRQNSASNNFENYVEDILESLLGGFMGKGENRFDAEMAPGASSPTYGEVSGGLSDSINGEYVETTDNQVSGVIEADLIKRTKTHIFYLNSNSMTLKVYSIKGEESRLVSEYVINPGYANMLSHLYGAQIFLSEDGKTLTVLGSGVGYTENASEKSKLSVTILISLDVSDPDNIKPKDHFAISGDYLSARLVDGKILLMSRYYVNKIDYENEQSFLPVIDRGEGFEVMSAEDIVFPDTLTSKYYTVVAQVDMETLELEGAAGCLCYSDQVYVSNDKIFLTRAYTGACEVEDDGVKFIESKNMTEIFALGYGEGGFSKLGSVTVDGRVKNQYSLDEYEGVLRVVTTTSGTKYMGDAQVKDGVIEWGKRDGEALAIRMNTNAALFCIDLESFEIIGEVRDFAPDGETVESVRFDGTNAYVCTAVVITFTDPVYFFDLSDMSNITYTDTGVIKGYSSSLVNFGDGFLLGIGYGASRDIIKIEVYVEEGDKVESVCAYEIEGAEISSDYKSYFIDRERGLVGLMVNDFTGKYEEYGRYILLSFNGYKLYEVLNEGITYQSFGDLSSARATLADDYFYVMHLDEFKVLKIYN
ncbi:MAG: beta-propeller domain-containing protein [Clostridia bacterium]|nr:beta-propeller domain-containing protein [Clostridia bacterium]